MSEVGLQGLLVQLLRSVTAKFGYRLVSDAEVRMMESLRFEADIARISSDKSKIEAMFLLQKLEDSRIANNTQQSTQ